LIRGWTSCRLHAATLDHPQAARMAKRLMGRGEAHAGAQVWSNEAEGPGVSQGSRDRSAKATNAR
jgi:hypothetical protein